MSNICDELKGGQNDSQGQCPFTPFMKRSTYPTGSYLYCQGASADTVFHLHSGMVALERATPDGKMVVTKLVQPGGLFPLGNLSGEGHYASSARALVAVNVCAISGAGLQSVASTNAHTAFCLFRRGCDDARADDDAIAILLRADLPERILALLADLGRHRSVATANDGLHFTLPISWQVIANVLGTRREVLSRLLRKLMDAGHIDYQHRDVTLFRRPAPTVSESEMD